MGIYADALAAAHRVGRTGGDYSHVEKAKLIPLIRQAAASGSAEVATVDGVVDTQFDILDAFTDMDSAATIVAAIATASAAVRAASTAAVAAVPAAEVLIANPVMDGAL